MSMPTADRRLCLLLSPARFGCKGVLLVDYPLATEVNDERSLFYGDSVDRLLAVLGRH